MKTHKLVALLDLQLQLSSTFLRGNHLTEKADQSTNKILSAICELTLCTQIVNYQMNDVRSSLKLQNIYYGHMDGT